MIARVISEYAAQTRLNRINDRLNSTEIPSLASSFSKRGIDSGTSNDIIDKVYFTRHVNTDSDGSSAISAMLLNAANVEEIRRCGGLGAVLEMLKRYNVKENPSGEQLMNLVRSLHVIIIGSRSAQQKCLSNPYAVDLLLSICAYTSGKIQSLGFEILDALSKVDGVLACLIEKNVTETMMCRELLTKKSNGLESRRAVANLIYRCALLAPSSFPIAKYEEVVIGSDGTSRLDDGHMELQLLHSAYLYLVWHNECGKVFKTAFQPLRYLLNQIISETFESVEHIVLIMKIVTVMISDLTQLEFMLDNNLDVAMQYVVRTDFKTYRKKVFGNLKNDSALESPRKGMQEGSFSPSKLSAKQNRSSGTLLALALINRQPKPITKNEDFNFLLAKMVLNICDMIMDRNTEFIGEIVASGLFPGLLFFVGKGHTIDKGYCKLVSKFITSVLKRILDSLYISTRAEVCDEPPKALLHDPVDHAMVISTELSIVQRTLGESYDENISALGDGESSVCSSSVTSLAELRIKTRKADIRTISHTMHAQGVTEMFISSILSSDDVEVIQNALQGLSYMLFDAIHELIYCNNALIARICMLCSNRMDCFFPGVVLLTSIILYKPLNEDLVDQLIMDFKAIHCLVKGLNPASFLFALNNKLYTSMSKLSVHPKFYSMLRKADGVVRLVYEMEPRKKKLTTDRRARGQQMYDEDGTLQLLRVLRKDFAAVRIQHAFRRHLKAAGKKMFRRQSMYRKYKFSK